jgi:formylglycine-generating enzyme required for sulfatase activity
MLVGGSILGIIAWFNQSRIEQVWNEHWNVKPYRRANFDKYVLPAARDRGLKAGDSFRECAKDCPEMIVIPAGSFTMGSPESETGRLAREGPQHEVTIAKRFAVSKSEVTWDEWGACVKYGDCPHISDSAWGRETRPVINVTWVQVKQYVAWLSKMTGQTYRLLTEAEWSTRHAPVRTPPTLEATRSETETQIAAVATAIGQMMKRTQKPHQSPRFLPMRSACTT